MREIGEVVDLIRNIGGQTHLLAPQRHHRRRVSGKAGRGFVVVDSEVKSLAVQTGHATEEITGQIEAVQNATRFAVEAIRRNTERMREIAGFASAVAHSLEQHNSATAEISAAGRAQRAGPRTW